MDGQDSQDTTNAAAATITAPAAAAAPTKAELRAAELKAKREAKEAEKIARAAELKNKRKDGVIGTLAAALDTKEGTTRNEILAKLTAKFPDRDPVGMAVTVGIQLSRLAKSTGRKIVNAKIEPRGRIYGFADKVEFPQAVLAGPPLQVMDSTPESRGTTNEALADIGQDIVDAKATPEPKAEAPKLTVSKGGNKGKGKKK